MRTPRSSACGRGSVSTACSRKRTKAGDKSAAVAEVVRLGEAFSIVTEHTSFLVLENDGEYQRWKIERRNALRTEREARQLQRLREQLASMRRGGEEEAGPEGVKKQQAPDGEWPTTRIANRIVRAANPNAAAPQQPPQRQRGADIDLGGGGAIDPLTAVLALALAGIAAAASARRWMQ